jgi:hypothetical protein
MRWGDGCVAGHTRCITRCATQSSRLFSRGGLLDIEEADEATTLLDNTIRQVDENGDFFFMPEALRIRGRALVLMERLDDAEI